MNAISEKIVSLTNNVRDAACLLCRLVVAVIQRGCNKGVDRDNGSEGVPAIVKAIGCET